MPTGKTSLKKKPLARAKKAAASVKSTARPSAKSSAKSTGKAAAKTPAKPIVAKKPKAAAPPKPRKKITVAAPPQVTASRAADGEDTKNQLNKYTELFGPSHPKGKGLNPQGEPISAQELAAQGWCVMQFPPRPGRLSWIYATHGLATARAKEPERPIGIELVMHSRERDLAPLQVLFQAANYLLQSGHSLKPGEVISATEGIKSSAQMMKHFLAFDPEPTAPRALEISGGLIQPMVLLGISDEELESATKVRAELADGRVVLMDALRAGGVFPVSDPKRQCLTRRRDFLRIWETAFRAARERKG